MTGRIIVPVDGFVRQETRVTESGKSITFFIPETTMAGIINNSIEWHKMKIKKEMNK